MKEIKKVRLFVNETEKAKQVELDTKKELLEANFEIVEDNTIDLGRAIGGDGSFLRMVNDSNFKEDALYVGIHAGTLGFAQDIDIDEIKEFITAIKTNNFYYENIGIEDVLVQTKEKEYKFHCLNEIVIREEELNTIFLDTYIDDELLENYVGDGLLISTSFGSTAYNLSFGGTIVDNAFDTLQITPIAPMSNKTYRSLQNSLVIPSTKKITIIPSKTNNLLITTDGRNYNYKDVLKVETKINNHIHLIRKQDYNYIRKINDKFIK